MNNQIEVNSNTSNEWSVERIKGATITPRIGTYEVIPASAREVLYKKSHPELFKFKSLSVGDDNGQAFFIPLDESDIETAQYILRAIAAYKGK